MKKVEAEALANQLNINLPATKKVDALWAALEERGLTVGVDQTNGDWVVVTDDAARIRMARVS